MEIVGALDGVGIDAAGFHLFERIRHGVFPCNLCLELGDRYGGGVALVVEYRTGMLARHLTAYHARRRDIRIGEQSRRFPVAYMQHVGAVGEVRSCEAAYVDYGILAVMCIDDPFIGVGLCVGSGE